MSEPKLMRKILPVACAVLFLLAAMGNQLPFSKQAIAADQGIVIQGADYNSTIVAASSSGLVSVAGNVTQEIVMEYADFNIVHGLISSNGLNTTAASVAPKITVEYADYVSTNGLVTYLGPNNGSSSIAPSIESTRTPSGNVSVNQSVNVSAVVSDAGSGVQNATLQYNLNNGTDWVNVPMNLNVTVQPEDSLLLSYFGVIPGQPNGTYVSYRVVAWDFDGNSGSANGTPYTVIPAIPVDTTPPTIQSPQQNPLNGSVQDMEPVVVSANITDIDSIVENATIVYYTSSNATVSSVPMSLNSTSGLWQGTITGYPLGTTVYYNVTAYDPAGNLALNDNNGVQWSYTVPEFASVLIILMLFAMMTSAILLTRKKILH